MQMLLSTPKCGTRGIIIQAASMLSELSTVSTYPTVTTVSDYLLSLSLFIFFRGDERRAVVNGNAFKIALSRF